MAAVRWREENSLQLNRAFLEEQDQMREMMSVDNVRSLLNAKARLSNLFLKKSLIKNFFNPLHIEQNKNLF